MAVSSSAFGRDTPEDILQSAKPPQVAESTETRFDGETLIDRTPDGVGVTGRPESLAKPADFCGFKEQVRSLEGQLVHFASGAHLKVPLYTIRGRLRTQSVGPCYPPI
ncbi:hypothetical protein SBA2_370021 [Acidobacteriia bacterium SbA2]|nr:hypothetical protein SBA2_370021 [Acidobacteriia bacterium SbA2]